MTVSQSIVVVLLLTQTWSLIAQEKCGLVPTKVFLAKGEKRQFVFWTDQDYSQTTTTQSSTSPDDSEDPFLEFINNNKPTNAENEIEITFQQFPAVPPVPAVPADETTTQINDG